tara:strand:+ start:4397 stop:6052 length:1656 start_codon:yes stop_codon:yes gene_type:complete
MSSGQLVDTIGQVRSSVVFLSNAFFFSQAGYFAPASEMRVLLHTWSLSVEEQYYLLFGVLLFLGNKFSFSKLTIYLAILGWVIIIFAGLSVFIADVRETFFKNVDELEAAIFFLGPFRVFQFVTGSLCAIWIWKCEFKNTASIFQVLGALLLLLAFASSYSSETNGSLIASIAIIPGLCLILISVGILDRLGEVRSVQFIAKISYQIYLVHWPLIVFWRYWTFKELAPIEIAIIGIFSVFFGWVLYLCVGNFNRNLKIVACSFLLIILANVASHGGATWRLPETRALKPASAWRTAESAYCNGTHIQDGVEFKSQLGEPLETCVREVSGGDSIYVVGDSHARHLLPGLSETFPNHNIRIFYYSSCEVNMGFSNYVSISYDGNPWYEGCLERNKKILNFFRNIEPSNVFIHQYGGYLKNLPLEWIESMKLVTQEIQAQGHNLKWLGFIPYPNIPLAACLSAPSIFTESVLKERCQGNRETYSMIYERNAELNIKFDDIFINVNEFFCSEDSVDSCSAIRNELSLFRDKHHLTVDASIALIKTYQEKLEILKR